MLVGLKQVFQQQTETLLNSQVQLWSVSSLFRRANNRNQIRIPERETTAAVRFAVHRPTGCKYSFLQRPAVHCPNGNYTFIADVRFSVPSTNGISLRLLVIDRSAEGKSVISIDIKRLLPFGRVRFAGRREWNLSDDNFICRLATPKRTSRRLFFGTLPVPGQPLDEWAVVTLRIP